jgi:glutamine synthetase
MSGHVGRADFIERHGLWNDEQRSAAAEVLKQVSSRGLEVVRFSYPDQHGLLRNKSLGIGSVAAALRNGVNFTNAPFVFDTANSIVFNPFVAGGSFGRSEMEGFHDVVYVPDPLTFRVLPWTPGTGWMLGDLYFEHGEPLPYAPRTILRRCLATARQAGWDYLVGLEVEWYLTKLHDPELREEHLGAPGAPADPPRVHPIARGYQYLLESELDAADEIHRVIRRHLVDLGLPPRIAGLHMNVAW